MSRRVLISGVGKRNALIQLMQVEADRYGIEIVGGDASELAPGRTSVAEFIRLPFARDPNFATTFTDILRDKRIDAFLTLIDPEIPMLAGLATTDDAKLARCLHPVQETTLICDDKYSFAKRMLADGIATIPTGLEPPTALPFIRKDRCGSAGSGFRAFHKPEDVDAYRHEHEPGRHIFQPFHGGLHYCVDAYYSLYSNRLIDGCAKVILSKDKGESFVMESAKLDPFVEILEKIGKTLPLRGIVNLDFFEDAGGLRIVEINCRIGGNYPACHAFGCNLIKHLFEETFVGRTFESSCFSCYSSGMRIGKYFGFSLPYKFSA